MLRTSKGILFSLFAISGFTGLVYESIWCHYLKLFLGHAAYAQTLVIAIFMGGMALGAWLCSRFSRGWQHLLVGYAATEMAIGVFAIAFHEVFDTVTGLAYTELLPLLPDSLLITLAKWILSTLLIFPQSVLLGMTFPLMTSAVVRLFPDDAGVSVSMLYFSNTAGAVVGVLASGFWLVRVIGLPGTIRLAGILNLFLGIFVWLLVKKENTGPYAGKREEESGAPFVAGNRWYPLLLAASFVTGTASFIYEIGWIRMLSMVLGSSTHSFELMLAAFLLGIGFGSLWIRQRIRHMGNPTRFLASVQIIMGLAALSTLLVYGRTFSLMHGLLDILRKDIVHYFYFNLASNGIALILMLPATFCAGMTLPLITHVLLQRGLGERSIGAVYAANTLGAIFGIFFAIHVGLPLLGLKNLIVTGASLDIALGLCLFWLVAARGIRFHSPAAATVVCVMIIAVFAVYVHLDPYKMASGVFRESDLLTPETANVIFHKDGKTATVSLTQIDKDILAIRTNGKIDASINLGWNRQRISDDVTQVQLAAIPMAIHPTAQDVAVIGIGSGVTTNVLLKNPSIRHVETVEIEPFMVEAARHFENRVALTFTDPRSTIHIDDAKTFFSTHHKSYDLIISEPSNPWVSGVASLFSREFFELIGRHLHENGIFAQWVQLYEIDMDLVASILKAVDESFLTYTLYALDQSDLLILATNSGDIPPPDPDVLALPAIAQELNDIYVRGPQDLEFRWVGDKNMFSSYLSSLAVPSNSDYFPFLDQNAEKTRFLKSDAKELHGLPHHLLPFPRLLSPHHSKRYAYPVTISPYFPASRKALEASTIRDYHLSGSTSTWLPPLLKTEADTLKAMGQGTVPPLSPERRMQVLFNQAMRMIPYLDPDRCSEVWENLRTGEKAAGFTAREQDWISLFLAVTRRDGNAILQVADGMLVSEIDLPTHPRDFLFAAALAGARMSGNHRASTKLWEMLTTQSYRSQPLPLHFQILRPESPT